MRVLQLALAVVTFLFIFEVHGVRSFFLPKLPWLQQLRHLLPATLCNQDYKHVTRSIISLVRGSGSFVDARWLATIILCYHFSLNGHRPFNSHPAAIAKSWICDGVLYNYYIRHHLLHGTCVSFTGKLETAQNSSILINEKKKNKKKQDQGTWCNLCEP